MINNAEKFLREFAENFEHGKGDYLDHCFDVYNILKEWNCDEDVCLAGLFHSIYGTESFTLNKETDSKHIVSIIGPYSEKLVREYSKISNRDITILENAIKDASKFNVDLKSIAHANLISQTKDGYNDPYLNKLIKCFENFSMEGLLMELKKQVEITNLKINDKNIVIFDNMLENHYIEALNDWCYNSKWMCTHGTSKFTYQRDERFASYFTKEDFIDCRLNNVIKNIANYINEPIYVGSSYANHYSNSSFNHRHCDSSIPDTYTALLFSNKHWDETWGGELKFYTESKVDYMVDFIPGRVVFFDSRIEHKVLPLTSNAEKWRFSIAVKCATKNSINYLEESFSKENIIKVEND